MWIKGSCDIFILIKVLIKEGARRMERIRVAGIIPMEDGFACYKKKRL